MTFENAYNRLFAGRVADTKLMALCEELWNAAVRSAVTTTTKDIDCATCANQFACLNFCMSEREACVEGSRYKPTPPIKLWRAAEVATNGVEAVKTAGKADSPIAHDTRG